MLLETTSDNRWRLSHNVGMDSKQSIRKKMTEKQQQLETMVRSGMTLTHPSVVALSQDIDRLVLLLSVGPFAATENE